MLQYVHDKCNNIICAHCIIEIYDKNVALRQNELTFKLKTAKQISFINSNNFHVIFITNLFQQ